MKAVIICGLFILMQTIPVMAATVTAMDNDPRRDIYIIEGKIDQINNTVTNMSQTFNQTIAQRLNDIEKSINQRLEVMDNRITEKIADTHERVGVAQKYADWQFGIVLLIAGGGLTFVVWSYQKSTKLETELHVLSKQLSEQFSSKIIRSKSE